MGGGGGWLAVRPPARCPSPTPTPRSTLITPPSPPFPPREQLTGLASCARYVGRAACADVGLYGNGSPVQAVQVGGRRKLGFKGRC